MAKSGKGSHLEQAAAALRAHALRYPEAVEEFPWGESAFKVKRKVFLFMRGDAEVLSLSTKLPHSASVALSLPFATPTGYGLGKAGWVSAEFTGKQKPPLELLCEWVDESYRAIAPAKVVAKLHGDARATTAKKTPRSRAAKTKARSKR
jgi:predicted DNA-binding protein (MmcQ/YjbR family)